MRNCMPVYPLGFGGGFPTARGWAALWQAEDTPGRVAPGRIGEAGWGYWRPVALNSNRPRSALWNLASLPFAAISRMMAA